MLDACSIVSPEAEARRLDAHFRRVLASLHRASPPRLTRRARIARQRNLAELERYWRRGRFPKQRRSLVPIPQFIDEAGTRCAMAHLIEQSGEADLVHAVAETDNAARIHALAGVRELAEWLDENGLTLEEAARIQPEYCGTHADCACHGEQHDTVLEGPMVDSETLRVTAVHGEKPALLEIGSDLLVSDNYQFATTDDLVLAGYRSQQIIVVEYIVKTDPLQDLGCLGPEYAMPMPAPLPKEVLIAAMLGPSCPESLAAHDPAWAVDPCQQTQEEEQDSGENGAASEEATACAIGSTLGTSGSALMVLSIAGLMVARRWRLKG